MPTFVLTWNPDKWPWPEAEFDAAVEATAAGRTVPERWSTGIRRSGIAAGDRGYLLRQRRERGLVASGTFSSAIYEAPHWDGSGRLTTYADIDFDVVLPVADRLHVADLKREVPGVAWDRMQGSGVVVAVREEASLDAAWLAHTGSTPWRTPEELSPSSFEEGALTRIEVNRYERDRAARKACIAHHGTTCGVCGFNYENRYGTLGRDFIHVHHLREISTLGPGYQVDAVNDLLPLCANCHAMAHRTRPALTPAALKRRLR